MSEWGYLLATFWVFWLVDGLRWTRRASWNVAAGLRPTRARVEFGRWHWPSVWPAGWRTLAPEVPFSLSPEGICNRPAGNAGRPVDAPSVASAFRWEDVRTVTRERDWLHINGHRFCPDTGHLSPAEILSFAALPHETRGPALQAVTTRWLRPAHLHRRTRILRHHTAGSVAANQAALLGAILTTFILLAGPAEWLPETTLARLGALLPALVTGIGVLHAVGIILARQALRRCRPARPFTPDTRLHSAALFPPQALRLRALISERFFPPQHPLAFALAFSSPSTRAQMAFDVLADLRWPAGGERDPSGAREITAWWRQTLEATVRRQLAAIDLNAETLLAPPSPSSPDACLYCPRCRDQFVAGPARCIHGVPLQPLAGSSRPTIDQRL
jgi:hypothetical protein